MRQHNTNNMSKDKREKRLLADRRAARKLYKKKAKENNRQDLRRQQDQKGLISLIISLPRNITKSLSGFAKNKKQTKKLKKQGIPHVVHAEYITDEEKFHEAQINLTGILTLYNNDTHKIAEKLEVSRIEVENLLNYEFGEFKLQAKLSKRINNFASLTVSLKDTLTKAYNPYYLEQRTKQFFEKKTDFNIYHLDLKQFKSINETYGYAAGDKILINFTRRLNRILNTGDFVVRLGGDKFAVVQLNNSEDLPGKILNSIKRPFYLTNIDDQIKISTAINNCPSCGFKDIDTMLKTASESEHIAK
ncbi:MAG: GGDEF domain-containing protein [Proteobacteria bacterium]|nr:GGDEF domain-containing protein [Pseudomonadota bacterium]